MKLAYITGNQGKFDEASHILKNLELEHVAIDLDEIQGDPRSILIDKAKRAMEKAQRPLIVEDVSMICPGLGGLPGAYVKDFLKALGEQGLYEVVEKTGDSRAEVICLAALMYPGEAPQVFEGSVKGRLVKPRGTTRHSALSWNAIFLADGQTKTFGELSYEELGKISHRFLALSQLQDAVAP